jgi:hypothetical protein
MLAFFVGWIYLPIKVQFLQLLHQVED